MKKICHSRILMAGLLLLALAGCATNSPGEAPREGYWDRVEDSVEETSLQNRLTVRVLPGIIQKDIFMDKLETGRDRYAQPLPRRRNLKDIEMTVETYQEGSIVRLEPEENGREGDILFLHGGAYINQASKNHWNFISDMVRRTGLTAHCIDYPLAPENHSGEALSFVYDYYAYFHGNLSREKIFVMGDSAGGGLALSLLMKIRNEQPDTLPERAFLISPFLDSACTDPLQQEYEKVDPLLSIDGLRAAGKAYAGTLPLTDWRVNPLYGDMEALCPLSIFTSDLDVLYRDSVRLTKKMDASGIDYRLHSYTGVIHDWVIVDFFPESEEARNVLAEEILSYF